MTNKGKLKYFSLGVAVSTVWFCVLGLILLLIGGGVSLLNKGNQTGAISDENIEKIAYYQELLQKYYFEGVSEEEMADGVLYGLMKTVGDPYTCYYSVEEMKELTSDLEGVFFGIGAYLEMDNDAGYAKISGVIEGTPASRADIQIGDYVVKVDGVNVYGKTLTEVVSMIRGEVGTQVVLTLKRGGEEIEVTVTRENIKTPTVKYELLETGIAHITITEFADVTPEQFTEALAQMEEDHANGLILDLRGNPGGSLTAVVDVCKQILPEGMIVYTEDKYGTREEYKCDGMNELNVPMVVLVDRGSASASEILAGAIKDHGKGILVGTTTYGKGIVQKIFTYEDGSAAKITVSKYYTPNGYNIHGVGIEPDRVVEWDSEMFQDTGVDNQLEEAIRILKEELM